MADKKDDQKRDDEVKATDETDVTSKDESSKDESADKGKEDGSADKTEEIKGDSKDDSFISYEDFCIVVRITPMKEYWKGLRKTLTA